MSAKKLRIVLTYLLLSITLRAQSNMDSFMAPEARDLLDCLQEYQSAKLDTNHFAKADYALSGDGYLRYVSAPLGHAMKIEGSVARDPETTAKNFLRRYKEAFGHRSPRIDFKTLKVKTNDNRHFVRLCQTYESMEVFGAQMIVQMNDAGGIQYVNDDTMRDTDVLDRGQVPVIATVKEQDAQEKAIELLSSENPHLEFGAGECNLMIYDPLVVGNQGPVCMVWQTKVVSVSDDTVAENVLVDAHTSEIVLRYSLIKTVLSRKVYDALNKESYPGTLCRSEGSGASGHVDCDSAYNYLGDTYNFYYNYHGRDSINNIGLTLKATVRFCIDGYECPLANAGWHSEMKQVFFGQGYAVDDVTGHELTHGVTEYESGLLYYNESGAIDESFCDSWGEWIDQTNGRGNDSSSVKWLMGEDLPGGAQRDMSNPAAFGQPDQMDSYYWYSGDDSDTFVHTNSGVGNKLVYLLTEGGTFLTRTVTGTGILKTSKLFYEAQTNLLTSSANYLDLYAALKQAAINLAWTQTEKQNLEDACAAVYISTAPLKLTNAIPAAGSVISGTKFGTNVVFSQRVYGFDYSDIVLSGPASSGAYISNLWEQNSYGGQWLIGISGLKDGTLIIKIAPDPGDITSYHGAGLEPRPTELSYIVNCNAPSITGVLPADQSFIINETANIDISFSEPVVGIDSTDAVLSGSAAITATVGVPVYIGSNVWRFPVSGLSEGSLNILFAPDRDDIEDVYGWDVAATQKSFSVDLYAPTIDSIMPTQDVTIIEPTVPIDITFSEKMFGLDPSDVTISGSAALQATVGHARNAGNNTWRFPITGLSEGVLEINLTSDPARLADKSGQAVAGNLCWIYQVRFCRQSDLNADFRTDHWDLDIFVNEWLQPAEYDCAKLTPLNPKATGRFGYNISADENYIIVGAEKDQDDGALAGSAYICEYTGRQWAELYRLTPLDGASGDKFGYSVAIDGDLAIVGASEESRPNITYAGAAYIFKYNGLGWNQQQKLIASDAEYADRFGSALCINGDYAIVGATCDDNGTCDDSGSAYIFKYNGLNWVQEKKLLTLNTTIEHEEFGYSVWIKDNLAAVGTNPGYSTIEALYLFYNNGSDWIGQQLKANDAQVNDCFGMSFSIDDNNAIIGAVADDDKGDSSGSAYIFTYNGATWVQKQKLTASDGAAYGYFGVSVLIDGAFAFVGSSGANGFGAVYQFEYNGNNWIETKKIVSFDGSNQDCFGARLCINSNYLIVSATRDDDVGNDAGSVYLFKRHSITDFNLDENSDLRDFGIFSYEWLQ